MTPDLERAARAAEDATDPVKHDHWTFVEVARAVLLALREPSVPVIDAVQAQHVEIWQSMIDAILKESA